MKDNNPADNGTARHLAPAYLQRWQSGGMLRRSMLALLLAAFMQGIAFACLYPIIDALLRETRRNFLTGLWPSASPQL